MDEPTFLRAHRDRYRAAGVDYAEARRMAMADWLRARLGLPAIDWRAARS